MLSTENTADVVKLRKIKNFLILVKGPHILVHTICLRLKNGCQIHDQRPRKPLDSYLMGKNFFRGGTLLVQECRPVYMPPKFPSIPLV